MKQTYRDVNDTWAPRSITNGNINGEGYHRGVTTTWIATQTNVNINTESFTMNGSIEMFKAHMYGDLSESYLKYTAYAR